jgi:uncharacterized protein YqhQ
MGFLARSAAVVAAVARAPLLIGGQAVMEGVMMKSRHHLATAVRKEDDSIKLRHRREETFAERYRLDKLPLVRGVVILLETLVLGLRELNWSANQSLEEEERFSPWELALTLVISLAFALALFKLLPLFLATLITRQSGGGNWTLNLLDGLIKFVIFVCYLLLIGQMHDVKRLFQYHGAEHKSVNCYEAGKELSPRNAKRFTKQQARCGTTFVVYVFVLSILVYIFIPFGASFWTKYLLRILLLPVIASIAYEWIRVAGRYYAKSGVVRAVSAPGMAVQALTTREPSAKQLEVAIAALKAVLKEEEGEKDVAA